jgi:transaldolase
MLNDGGLARYVQQDGIRGVTANPTIFAQAIGAGEDYDEQIADLLRQGIAVGELFEPIATQDIRHACDILRPVFDASTGSDGLVSIEVSPAKAFDTQATIDEAKRWWKLIDRPNLLVKIPATEQGLPAIEECLAAGVSINITLIFAIEFYERVMEAYLRALERRAAAREGLASVNSVASFFVSRVDTATDRILEARIAATTADAERKALQALLGRIAVANARIAYQRFREVFGSERFRALSARGAKVQRPLWASTGTKNAAYSDILYVQELIGPDSVNTMPPKTIDAFRDHGVARCTIDEGVGEAREQFATLERLGISLAGITDSLQHDGVEAFIKSFEEIQATISAKADRIRKTVSAA